MFNTSFYKQTAGGFNRAFYRAQRFSIDNDSASYDKSDVDVITVTVSRNFLGAATARLTITGGKEAGEDYGIGKNYTGAVVGGVNTAWVNAGYESNYTTVTFGANDVTRTVDITIVDNQTLELDRVLSLSVGAPSIGMFDGQVKHFTVVDDNIPETLGVREIIDVTDPNNGLARGLTALDKTGVAEIAVHLKAAWTYLLANGGGILYFPDGIYKLDQNLPNAGSGQSIVAVAGTVPISLICSDNAIIRHTYTAAPPTGSDAYRMFFTDYGHLTDDSACLSWQKLKFDFDGCIGSYEHNDCIFLSESSGNIANAGRVLASVESCTFSDGVSYGISVYDGAEVRSYNNTFSDFGRCGLDATGGYSLIDISRTTFSDNNFDIELEPTTDSAGYGGSRQNVVTVKDCSGDGGCKLTLISDASSLTATNWTMLPTSKGRTIGGYGCSTYSFTDCDMWFSPHLGSAVRNTAVTSPGIATFTDCNCYAYYDGPDFPVEMVLLGTGNGSDKTFAGTLDAKPLKAGSFTVTDSQQVESFVDNGDATLTGSQGGTGTINYTTGAYSVTFHTAPITGFEVYGNLSYNPTTAPTVAAFPVIEDDTALLLSSASIYLTAGNGWSGTGWTLGDSAVHVSGTTPLTKLFDTLDNTEYLVTFTVAGMAGGNTITPGIGGGVGAAINTDGIKAVSITTTGTSGGVTFTPTNGFTGSIDSVYVYTSGQRITFDTCVFAADSSAVGQTVIGVQHGLSGAELTNTRDNKLIFDTCTFDDSIDIGVKTYDRGGIWEFTDCVFNSRIALNPGMNASRCHSLTVTGGTFNCEVFIKLGTSGYTGTANVATHLTFTGVAINQANNKILAYASPIANTISGSRAITGTLPISATFRPDGFPGDTYTAGATTWTLPAGKTCYHDADTDAEVGAYTLWSVV
jgi:hypothetical protein